MPECPRMRTAVPDSKESASAASRSCHGERAITKLIWHAVRCGEPFAPASCNWSRLTTMPKSPRRARLGAPQSRCYRALRDRAASPPDAHSAAAGPECAAEVQSGRTWMSCNIIWTNWPAGSTRPAGTWSPSTAPRRSAASRASASRGTCGAPDLRLRARELGSGPEHPYRFAAACR